MISVNVDQSPIPLVFMRYVSSRNSDGLPLSGASNKGVVGDTGHFSTFKPQFSISKTIGGTSKVTIND